MRAATFLLIAAALLLPGCSDEKPDNRTPDDSPVPEAFDPAAPDAPEPGGASGHPSQVGSGGSFGG